jgi:hypothetical protein
MVCVSVVRGAQGRGPGRDLWRELELTVRARSCQDGWGVAGLDEDWPSGEPSAPVVGQPSPHRPPLRVKLHPERGPRLDPHPLGCRGRGEGQADQQDTQG